jgi:hypothetical protein
MNRGRRAAYCRPGREGTASGAQAPSGSRRLGTIGQRLADSLLADAEGPQNTEISCEGCINDARAVRHAAHRDDAE